MKGNVCFSTFPKLLCLGSSVLSGSSFSLSSSGRSLSFLVSHLLGNSLVDLLLSLESLGSSLFLSLSHTLTNGIEALYLSLLPSIELALCSSLVESALLNATAQVLHHVNAL